MKKLVSVCVFLLALVTGVFAMAREPVYRRPSVYKTDRLHLGYSCSKLSLFKGILFLRDEQDAKCRRSVL